jgi:sialidase-1
LASTGKRAKPSDRVLAQAESGTGTVVFETDAAITSGEQHFWIGGTLRPDASLDDRVFAVIDTVETTAGTVKPTAAGPLVGHRIGVALRQAGQEGVHTYRIPALATTKSGTLLCVYDVRRKNSKDLQGDIDVGLSRSADGGSSWEPMRIIMDQGTYGGLPESQNGIGDPGLVVDHTTGEIFVFALWVHAKPGKHQWVGDGSEAGFEIGKTAQIMMTRSTDDGITWSPAVNLTQTLKMKDWLLLAPSPQHGIQLRDGTLVMPAQGRTTQDAFATLIISRDHGQSWTTAPMAYVGGNECQAVELADGSIMLNIRNGDQKKRAVVVSKDSGNSWALHPTHANALIEPTCNASLYRWTTASPSAEPALLLFANPQDTKKRVRHTIQVSSDDGLTWPVDRRLLLDEGTGAGYPSISRVDDQHVGIVYEGSQSHLVFERISRAELLPKPPR